MTAIDEYLPDEPATTRLATRLSHALPPNHSGWVVLLEGELGAGKSTFARGLIRALGHRGTIPSPTYTLVEPYELPGGTVYHIDLYRVSDPEELRYLGFDEFDRGLRLIEWPERANLEEVADIRARLAYQGKGRHVRIEGLSARGAKVVAAAAPA